MVVGIVGTGVVGSAAREYYANAGFTVVTYDRATDEESAFESLDAVSDVILVCVSTPGTPQGLSCTNVKEVVMGINCCHTIGIKSTVMPGFTRRMAQMKQGYDIFYWPEFLDEDTAEEDFANPRRPHVIGYDGPIPNSLKTILETPGFLPPVEDTGSQIPLKSVYFTSTRNAELIKLGTNFYYGMRVAFANIMADFGMSQDAIDIFKTDDRIGSWGLQVVHKGYRGYGGACLPKDINALAVWSDNPFIKGLIAYNNKLLEDQGLGETAKRRQIPSESLR